MIETYIIISNYTYHCGEQNGQNFEKSDSTVSCIIVPSEYFNSWMYRKEYKKRP